MADTNSLRTFIAATSYNGAVFAEGSAPWTTTTVNGKTKLHINVLPGQWLNYNPATGLSTGTAATKSTVPNLMMGLGVDWNDDGVSDDILWVNDGMDGCSMTRMVGKEPACGLSHIVDATWGCIECNKTYTFQVQVFDPISESFGEKGLGYIYHFSYHYPCGNCASGDCVDPTPNADEVMCGLYNKIKGIHNDPNWDVTLNDLPLPADHEYLFDVSKLYDGTAADFADDTTFEYCLSATDGTCDNCNLYTPIGGYSLDGDPDVVFSPATFTGTNSSRGQIDLAVAQLNAALAGNGSATFLPAVGNCCTNNKLEVNTCLVDFELHDHEGTVIVPCATSNPFSDYTIYSECQDCDSSNSTNSHLVGLRFYSKPVEGSCQCIPGNKTKYEYFSELRVSFIGAFNLTDFGTRVVTRQYPTLPKGQGFQWQIREIREARDGFRDPYVVNNWGGSFGYPEDNDILNQVTVNCKDAYCVIGGQFNGKTRHDSTGETKYAGQAIYILIPTDHATAKTSILLGLNNYFAGGDCGLPTITCAAY